MIDNRANINALGEELREIKPVDYFPIANYEVAPSVREHRFNVLTYGIPAAYDFIQRYLDEHNLQEAVIYCMKRPVFLTKRILFAALIQVCIDTYRTYGSLKTALLVILKAIRLYRNRFPKSSTLFKTSETDESICWYINQLLSRLKDLQMKEKALETSVITGCSPIVPYAGVLKKPFVGEIVKEESEKDPQTFNLLKEQIDEETENDYETMLQSMEAWYEGSDIDIKELILSKMLISCVDIVELGCIMEYRNFYREPILPLNRLGTLSIAVNGAYQMMNHNGLNIARRYYALAFIFDNLMKCQDSEERRRLLEFANAVFAPLDQDFSTMFSRLEHMLPASEGALLSEIEHYDAMDKFMKNPETYLAGNTDRDPLELFDLTPLMNYIFTNRRFRTNQYTRSAFMDIPSIGGYTFYKGFLIVEPETPQGHDMNYLYIPVIDDLNGSQVAVIKYWRNGNIDILTESQFNAEIQG